LIDILLAEGKNSVNKKVMKKMIITEIKGSKTVFDFQRFAEDNNDIIDSFY
jgi:hypothetical protein